MGQINWMRVLLGGLVAGLIINIGETVLNGFLLREDWASEMRALNRPEFGGGQIGIFMLIGFLTGIAGVWLYAAIRPRYGAGPKTAVCAGLGLWGLNYLLPSLGFLAVGVFSQRLIVIGTVWGLVELAIAVWAGARVYKEAPATSSSTAAAAGAH
jgi:hypothetical protein